MFDRTFCTCSRTFHSAFHQKFHQVFHGHTIEHSLGHSINYFIEHFIEYLTAHLISSSNLSEIESDIPLSIQHSDPSTHHCAGHSILHCIATKQVPSTNSGSLLRSSTEDIPAVGPASMSKEPSTRQLRSYTTEDEDALGIWVSTSGSKKGAC